MKWKVKNDDLDQGCCLSVLRQLEEGLPEAEVEVSEVQGRVDCEGHGVVER